MSVTQNFAVCFATLSACRERREGGDDGGGKEETKRGMDMGLWVWMMAELAGGGGDEVKVTVDADEVVDGNKNEVDWIRTWTKQVKLVHVSISVTR